MASARASSALARLLRNPGMLPLLIALLLGGALRFHALDRSQLSADEGASWAPATASTLGEVVALQPGHNPGKLPLYEVALHGWIALFGDGQAAMRSMSAVLGTFSLLLVFLVTRELFRCDGAPGRRVTQPEIDCIAGLAALLCAVSLILIKYSWEARMYPMMLAAGLAQTWFFLRTFNSARIVDFLGLVVFTAVLLAIQSVALSIPASEMLWLLYLSVHRAKNSPVRTGSVWIAAFGVGAGMAVIAPFLLAAVRTGVGAASRGALTFIHRPTPWAPVSLYNKATGTFPFPLLLALGAWGVWRGRDHAREAVGFALNWMWAPPLMMVALSYLWRPVFVERYALLSFPATFILVALGIQSLRSSQQRFVAIAIVIALSLGHVYRHSLKPHDTQFREATAAAMASLRPGETIAVFPAYAVEAVRYYAAPALRGCAVGFSSDDHAQVVIVAEHAAVRDDARWLAGQYPLVLARFRGVVVRGR